MAITEYPAPRLKVGCEDCGKLLTSTTERHTLIDCIEYRNFLSPQPASSGDSHFDRVRDDLRICLDYVRAGIHEPNDIG